MRTLMLVGILALWSWPSQAGEPERGLNSCRPVLGDLNAFSFETIEVHRRGGARTSSRLVRISGLPSRVEISAPGKGSAMATGRRTYEPIVFRKRIDKSTPLIAQALSRNEVLPRIVLRGRNRQTGRPVKVTLHEVKLLSRQGPRPRAGKYDTHEVEVISLTYQRIEVEG